MQTLFFIQLLSYLNMSEQDLCFDSKEFIDRERNAANLYDQRESLG